MSSFLESSSSPNIISSLLKFSNPANPQKAKPKPLSSLTIEQVRLKYIDPKPKAKASELVLPRIEQKNNSKIQYRSDKTRLNTILVDFSRHTIGSFRDINNSWEKKNLPILDTKTHSTCSNASSHTENCMEKNFTVSCDSFNLGNNLKNKFMYKMDENKQIKAENFKTNFRLQRLTNGEYNDSRDKIDGKKSRLKSRKKKSKLRKIQNSDSTNENSEGISYKSMEKTDYLKMTRVDSPHILKKSLPDSYKFMTHSSVCLGITSKDLVEQFESFQSNSYSNEALKN